MPTLPKTGLWIFSIVCLFVCLKKKEGEMVRENCLYSVNHVLNKTLIGQAGGVGGKPRQEVEMMQGEQENSGEEEVDSSHSSPDHRSSRM